MENRREALNVAIIVLLFLSISFIFERAYPAREGFLAALGTKDALEFGSGNLFYSITAGIYSAFAGGNFTPQGMLGFLGMLSLAMGILGIVSFYLALRNYGFSENPSLFGGVLFATGPAALFAFMPNYYSENTVALSICALGLAFFSLSRKSRAFFAIGGAVFLLAEIISPQFALFGIGFSLALSAEAGKKYAGEKKPEIFALPLALLLPSIAIASQNALSFSQVSNSLFDLKFLVPLGAICLAGIARNFEKEGDAFFASLFILGMIVSFANPYAALPMIAFSAGAGINWLLSQEKKERGERALAYVSFLFFLPLSFAGAADPVFSIVLACTVAVLLGALLYVYKFSVRWLPFAAACFLVLSSVVGGAVLSSAAANGTALHNGGRDLGSISADEYDAYSWIGKNAPAGSKVAIVWDGAAAEFLSGREIDAGSRKLVKFLAGNESAGVLKGEGFDYIVVSSGIFDYAQRFRDISGTSFRVESFSFYANISNPQGNAMLFRSGSGAYLMRQLGSDGKFAIADSGYFDASGAPAGSVPYSNIVVLDPALSPDSPKNRQIWVQGIYNTNAFEAFFGEIPGLENVYENAQARVFRVS